MKRSLRTAAPIALLVAAIGAYTVRHEPGQQDHPARPPAAQTAPPAPAPPRTDERVRDLDIAFYTERAARDPTGATDLAQLAALYLQRARETGDPADAIRAERAARRSLHNRAARNERARMVLTSSLLAQHRFADALAVARALSASEPDVAPYRASLGEIQLELGRYDEARATFQSLAGQVRELSVAPRYARWLEIEGQPEEARRILVTARSDAQRSANLPPEQRAWFSLRLGDLDLRMGRIEDAAREYDEGLRAHPDDYRLLAALAHLSAVRREWARAIDYGERSIVVALDPATLATLSDAYAALGDTARAEDYMRVLDVAVLRQPGAYHRAWSLFYLDHRRHLSRVQAKIRAELRTRRDIYGYDLLAWALHTAGHDAAARAVMARALAEGTQDALLFYHAGMIERALGHDAAARQYLERALHVNPYFHPTQPAHARAVLDTLARVRATE
jgi:tetratricopeptide (TPR) repeat protein